MFYRPDWVKAAAGANVSLAPSPGNQLLAVGSEDGYMFVYEYESGMPVGMKAPATKHDAPVRERERGGGGGGGRQRIKGCVCVCVCVRETSDRDRDST